jgi:N-terminal domain on NACHT_NTPase and P-loop NTPases/NB-ARC domain
MAEAAAAIGLVASIVQLIEVSAKIVTRVNEFASATTEVPKSFLALKDRVALLTITLQEVQRQVSGGLMSDAAAKVLEPIVKRSLTNTRELIRLIEKAVPNATSSRFGKLARALKSLAYDSKVQKIMTQLEKDIQAFIFNQTTRQTDAVERIRQDLAGLNVASNTASLNYSLGLCLGEAPQLNATSFVGRKTELAQLCESLTPRLSPSSQNVVALSGMGGLGKTQLSLAFAKQYQATYSSVLWLNAKDEPALRHDFVALSRRLFLNPSQVLGSSSDQQEEERAVHQVRQWLSEDGNDQWLVLLDNYDDPKLPGVKSETGFDVRQYFPYRSQGSILITTRSTRLTFAKSLKLQKLQSVEECVAILSERSGRNLSQGESCWF